MQSDAARTQSAEILTVGIVYDPTLGKAGPLHRVKETLRQHSQFVANLRKLARLARQCLADPDRSPEEGSHRNDAANTVRRDGRQPHRCNASARLTVWISAELARRDSGLEIRRQCLRRECKHAF